MRRKAPSARPRTGPRVLVADHQRRRVDRRAVAAVARAVLRAEGRPGVELSITLVDDAAIADLHMRYLGVPGPTDVISFPLDDDADDGADGGAPLPMLGEVVVSTDTAAREARARRLPLAEEVLRYVVHGLLHLLGYDDRRARDRARMHARQEEHLRAFLAGRRPRRQKAPRGDGGADGD